jgi:hypothetical protein
MQKQAKNAEYDERNRLPLTSREIPYDGKKWMVMFIYDDGDVDLKMQKAYSDKIPNVKIGILEMKNTSIKIKRKLA